MVPPCNHHLHQYIYMLDTGQDPQIIHISTIYRHCLQALLSSVMKIMICFNFDCTFMLPIFT